ncbi:unnamed protein product [Mortierella alpina]
MASHLADGVFRSTEDASRYYIDGQIVATIKTLGKNLTSTKLEAALQHDRTSLKESIAKAAAAADSEANIDHWRAQVMSHFDTSWQSIVQAQTMQQKLAVNETPSQDHVRRQTEDISTVTIPLHQALRPDMMHHYHTIRAMFAGAQDVATNMKSELCTLARMTPLKMVDGSVYQGLVEPQPDPSAHAHSTLGTMEMDRSGADLIPAAGCTFDIRRILPEGFQPSVDESMLEFPLAPVPPSLQPLLACKPKTGYFAQLDDVFSEGHFQFLQSRFLPAGTGTQEGTSTEHSFWSRLAQQIRLPDAYQVPRGYSSMFSAFARQLAVAMDNLWQGPVYSKSLETLCSRLLKLHLKPQAETIRKERAQQREVQRRAMKEERRNTGRARRKRFKSHTYPLKMQGLLLIVIASTNRKRFP